MKNKQISLRQLAKELGFSVSYLSQVKHGTRPASKELTAKLNALKASVKQNRHFLGKNALRYVRMLSQFSFGGVSELADEHDLGSCAARRRGSSPLFPTMQNIG